MAIFKKQQPEIPRRRRAESDLRTSSSTSTPNMFQRNRTLVGSTSDRVNTNYHVNDFQSPRTHVHHLASKRRKIGVILLAVIGFVALFGWLLVEFTASVKISVSDSGYAKPLETELYEKSINEYFARNPLTRLRFILSPDELLKHLNAELPEVASITNISLEQIGTTNITITMRRPVAGWTIDAKQYYVDANGVAFERNYFTAPTVQIVDNSGVSLQQGIAVASNRFLGFVGRIVALSKEEGYTVVQATIPAGTTRQLEIQLQETTIRVKLSIDRLAGEQTEDMARALAYLTSRGARPSYIDVRVSGKAFYR